MHGNYLAFDLGAESGRAVLGQLHAGILTTRDVHRFANEPVEYGGSLHWDVARLWFEIRCGLNQAELPELDGIGVDTWGVDYALLGEAGELLENPYHYRDVRTEGAMEEVFRILPRETIYETTGIQFMPINTIFQLFRAVRKSPRLFEAAKTLLTIPDLLNYWLTGKAVCEFTNATTTQLMDARTRTWARPLFEALGIPAALPAQVAQPGGVLGAVLPGVSSKRTPVILPATHDTGSAVAAIQARDATAFLSSGTWSLLGMELDAPVISDEARRLNFTNEGGVCGTVRLLKNVMGLWMLQGCRRAWARDGRHYEYADLIAAAGEEAAFRHLLDPDDAAFLRPVDMTRAMDDFCLKTDQAVPATPGAYVRAVLESLAFKYRRVLEDLERLTNRRIDQVRIIGGGSRNKILNQFTADATRRRVLAGPVEATALGNIAIQMLATGAAGSLEDARAIIDRSFATEIYEPSGAGRWDKEYLRFQQYCEYTHA
jgi:rhamnulokinase